MTFDDWRKTVDLNRFGTSDPITAYARAAFEAGAAAERERCAKVAETWADPEFMDFANFSIGSIPTKVVDSAGIRIAEAIRNPKG